MPRIRTTKKLAQRIDRSYVKRLFPIPRWRRILTGVCVAIGLAWLGIHAVARDQTPYTAGELTPAHAFLGKQCANCHGSGAAIGKRVADKQCASCHDAPIHNAEQTFTPACVDCHVEHRGVMQLVSASDQGCVACHGSLQTKSGKLTVAANISSFNNHPQFAAVVAGKDSTGLRFNHQIHVAQPMECSACHPPADTAQGLKTAPHTHASARAQLQIPTYAGVCMPCHTLNFDDKIADPAPHDKPAVVHQFVSDQLTKYIAAHPGDLGKNGAPGSAAAWVKFKVATDEKQLWETTCARCHTMQGADAAGLPEVAPTKISRTWFTRASFDHSAHQALTCASCHANAATSKTSADLLLPGIETCRQCHNSSKTSAGASCSTCHVYHDWSKEKGVDGKFMIRQITELLIPKRTLAE